MNIRITIKPLAKNKIHLIVEKNEVFGQKMELLSEYYVTIGEWSTQYEPVPPNKTFNNYPEEDQIKNLIRAYFDGVNQEEHYSWIYQK